MSGLTGFVLSLDGSVLKNIYMGFTNIQIRVNVPVRYIQYIYSIIIHRHNKGWQKRQWGLYKRRHMSGYTSKKAMSA